MGTSHRTIETPVFMFDQLSDEAKTRALDKNREYNIDHEWWDAVYEDADMMAAIMGINIDKKGNRGSSPSICFSGFSSQGDGASFEGEYSYKKGAVRELKQAAPARWEKEGVWVDNESNIELHRIAKGLQDAQRPHFYRLEAKVSFYGHYSHSGCTRIEVQDCEHIYRDIGDAEEDVRQLLRDFMDWIYARLEAEYDYLTSDEAVKEALQDTEFDEEGDRV